MLKMLLAIDIGNTNISFAVFLGKRIIKKFNLPTKDYQAQKMKQRLGKANIKDVLICSVVPQLTKELLEDLKGLLGKAPYIIGKDIKVPIKNLYLKPKQVGQDRLVNAYAGLKLYGAPLIVVDFGTAVTFDIVSKKKEYLGGMIFPGIEVSLASLNRATALLPKIKLGSPRGFIGRDTKSSMLNGVIYGFAALTNSLCKRIKNKIGKNAMVVATGGNSVLIAKYCPGIKRVDKDLTCKGLNFIYNNTLNIVNSK